MTTVHEFLKRLNASIERWWRRHVIARLFVLGIATLAFAVFIAQSNDPTMDPAMLPGFLLFGCGALGAWILGCQDLYLGKAIGRGYVETTDESVDEHVIVEARDAFGRIRGLDPRLIPDGGEVVIALLIGELFGLLGVLASAAFFSSAWVLADAIRPRFGAWAVAAQWGGGIIAGLAVLLALILVPLNYLSFWFRSRRVLARQQFEALRTLAAAARKDNSPPFPKA